MPPSRPPVQARRNSGPLGASSLSTLRCPSRTDFLQNPPRARSFSEGQGAEEEVATYLTAPLLDAMDRLEVFPELQAIVMWLDDVRAERGFELKVTDMDLSNGIALLDALYVIDSSLFEDIEYEGACGVPNSYVCRQLDENGVAAEKNVGLLRRTLAKVEWKEEGRALKGIDFEKVDIWGLAGFVVVAAYMCEQAAEFIRLMVGYDEWVQNALEEVVCRGIKTLGGGQGQSPRSMSSGVTTEESGGEVEWRKKVEELEKKLLEERRRRTDLNRVVERERRRAEMCEREKRRLEEAMKKMERKGGKSEVAIGVVQQLRLENSRLRKENARLRRGVNSNDAMVPRG